MHYCLSVLKVIKSNKMSTEMNLSTMAPHKPSLCIPRAFLNVDEARIRGIFGELGLGRLARIDIVNQKNDKGVVVFNRVFVHFFEWTRSEEADKVRIQTLNGKEVKIIYDDPWFWKVSAYRRPEPKIAPNPHPRVKKVSICFDEEEEPRKPAAVEEPAVKENEEIMQKLLEIADQFEEEPDDNCETTNFVPRAVTQKFYRDADHGEKPSALNYGDRPVLPVVKRNKPTVKKEKKSEKPAAAAAEEDN